MDAGRTVLLQYVAQLINIGRTHILFDHEVFKTGLLLNYKETLGALCNTSVNPVYQSLRSVLPEILSQLANLHSHINGPQNTSMDFLCSNIPQVNDNVVVVKSDVTCTKTVSNMQFLKYCSRFLNMF